MTSRVLGSLREGRSVRKEANGVGGWPDPPEATLMRAALTFGDAVPDTYRKHLRVVSGMGKRFHTDREGWME